MSTGFIALRGVWVWVKSAHIPREKLREFARATEWAYLISYYFIQCLHIHLYCSNVAACVLDCAHRKQNPWANCELL